MNIYNRYYRKYKKLFKLGSNTIGTKAKKRSTKHRVRSRPKKRMKQQTQKQAAGVAFIIIIILVVVFFVKSIITVFAVKISTRDIQEFKIAPEEIGYILDLCEEQNKEPIQTLTVYCIYNRFFKDKRIAYTKEQISADFFPKIDKVKSSISDTRYNRYYYIIDTLMTELKNFPVNLAESYMFGDTWGIKNKLCGKGEHNGTDMYDRENIKGRLPVYSMTAGVVESTGKRSAKSQYVGIRTEKGAFYLYDHLDKTGGLEVGTPVAAGTVIGSMGGDKNSPANVHIGIKLGSDLKRGGLWINPYPFLRYFETIE